MARPPKIKIDDKHLKQIQTMAGYGLSMGQIARVVGLSRAQFFEYARRDPRIKESIDQGRAIAASMISEALFRKARTGDMVAIKWYEITRLGISPDNGPILDEEELDDVELSKLSNDELKQLEQLLLKAQSE